MNRILVSVLLLVFVSILTSTAQSDVKIKKSEFNKGKAGFSQAWEHVISGNTYYDKKGKYFNNAFDHYIQAIAYNNSNPELNYKTGIAAIYTDRKEESAGFFLKALETKENVTDDILLYAGRALQYSGRYDEAIVKLNKYLKLKDNKSEENINLAKKFIEECNSAIILTKDTLNIEIKNLGANINSESDDFSPVFTYDGKTIYFASQRESKKPANYPYEFRQDENIYFSREINGSWNKAILAGEDINTVYNESPLYVDSAEMKLYIYSGFENGGDIKVSANRKGDWRSPENLPIGINTSESETSIAFSRSGNEIYFTTSSGKDNMGQHDIYVIKKISDKKWSKPQNLGPSVNTSYDEQSVSLSLYGDTLWFSSKGHNSIGGFDIFYTVRNQDGTWKQAINAGYPLNTPWDELFRTSPPLCSSAFYFSSNRSGGFGGMDIYSGRILPELPGNTIDQPEVLLPDTLTNIDTLSVVPVNDTSVVTSSDSVSVVPSDVKTETTPQSESPGNNDLDNDKGKYFLRED